MIGSKEGGGADLGTSYYGGGSHAVLCCRYNSGFWFLRDDQRVIVLRRKGPKSQTGN